MPQPFGIGDVVGGRYRITHHVVTSADQDIIFQATDQVLGRQVSVLLASRANAKQVATSAKELAAGARHSQVEVLDLGLAEDRTFLISTMVDPNQLLDLVVPDTAPYVEPYYTDSLGSELFGQSREIAPQTYDDDAEYYARLGGLAGGEAQQRRRGRRPAFLDKVTPGHRRTAPTHEPSYTQAELESELESAGNAHGLSISQEIARVSFSLRSDFDEVEADPAADSEEDPIEALSASPGGGGTPLAPGPAAGGPLASETRVDAERSPGPRQAAPGFTPEAAAPKTSEEPADDVFGASLPGGPLVESAPSAPLSTVAIGGGPRSQSTVKSDELLAEGEEVVDDPPSEPDAFYDRAAVPETSAPEAAGHPPTPQVEPVDPGAGAAMWQEPSSFTSLISAVPSRTPTAFPAADESHTPSGTGTDTDQRTSVTLGHWIAISTLGVLILAAAIVVFVVLTG